MPTRFLYPKILLFLAHCGPASPNCQLQHGRKMSCDNLDADEFTWKLHKSLWTHRDVALAKLEVLHSNVPVIERLYRTPDSNDTITWIKISECGLSEISSGAFVDFTNLEVLDLSYNALTNVRFLLDLPLTLSVLLLNNNRLADLDVDLTPWRRLRSLDLSRNRLKVLDLDRVRLVLDLDVGHNELYGLVATRSRRVRPAAGRRVNLFGNRLTVFKESDFDGAVEWLDLGGNRWKSVDVRSKKTYLGLANASVDDFVGEVEASAADLSGLRGLRRVKVVSVNLRLKNNELGDLERRDVDVGRLYGGDNGALEFLDLSNCSIINIPAGYFADLERCVYLDLSRNYVVELVEGTFVGSSVEILDLSYSKIRDVRRGAFRSADIVDLKLNGNGLTALEGAVFANSSIVSIDLSDNEISIIDDSAFRGLVDLERLILAGNAIDRLAGGAFKELKSLNSLDLSDNRFAVIDSGTFASPKLVEIALKGNEIRLIKRRSFAGLNSLKELDLSDLDVRQIEPEAFYDLKSLETIDLSNNRIELIDNIFSKTPALKKIDLTSNPIKTLTPLSNDLNIEELLLTLTQLTPNRISNSHVKSLTFKDTKLDTLPANSFKGMFSLTYLYFIDSAVDTIEPGAFNDLYSLRYLDTRNLFARFVGPLRDHLFNDLLHLEDLDLSAAKVWSLDGEAFVGLPLLRFLHLHHNELKRIESNAFARLDLLETLDLSYNEISALDDGAFGGLGELRTLLLSNNKLVTLPDYAFQDLNGLNYLYLDGNLLQSGALGKFVFDGLDELKVLSLSKNSIEHFAGGVFRQLGRLESLLLRSNGLGALDIGALAGLDRLRRLDLAENKIGLLNLRAAFVELPELRRLALDHNNLRDVEAEDLLRKCAGLREVGISFNKWSCDYLAWLLETLKARNVTYRPTLADYDLLNIDGITCIYKV